MTGRRDVTKEIELKNSRALPGWETHEIWHKDKRIGWIGSAGVDLCDDDYSIKEELEIESSGRRVTHIFFFKKEIELRIPDAKETKTP